jgi:AraC-like DNA-binding protein
MMSVLCANLNWLGLAREANYQRRKLAQCCGVSAGYLNQYFVTRFNRTPQKWLDELRIWEAYQLLCEGTSVKAVAYTLGFKQVSHFSRVFRKYHGFSPSECRERFLLEEKNREKDLLRIMPEETIPEAWRPPPIWEQAQQTLSLLEFPGKTHAPVEI